MRKKRKTLLSEIWDSVILTQSVLQLEFVVWYISQVSNSYLSLSTVFHRFQKQAHWAKLLPDYNLRATCHRVFTQMFHQLTRIAIWSHCSPVNIISWELPSMIFTPNQILHNLIGDSFTTLRNILIVCLVLFMYIVYLGVWREKLV